MDGATGEARSRRPGRRRRRLVAAVVLLAIVGGGLVWWVDQGRHRFFPKNWGVVEAEGIYRSGRIHRGIVEDVLKEHDVTLIVDFAAGETDDPDAIAEREAAKRLGIRKLDLVGLNGYGTGDLQDYAVAIREILAAREKGERVLVHGAGGSERTGGLVAFYRLLFGGWDGPRAWDEYRSYRVKPPERPDLPDYVNANLEELVDRLRRMGVPVDLPDPLPTFGPEGGKAP